MNFFKRLQKLLDPSSYYHEKVIQDSFRYTKQLKCGDWVSADDFKKITKETAGIIKKAAKEFVNSIFPCRCIYCGTRYKIIPDTSICIMCGAPGIEECNE